MPLPVMSEHTCEAKDRNQPFDARHHWLAHYQAELISVEKQTRLGRSRGFGPLRVQRPFYPEGPGCAHLYILHPPGGLVAGDRLTIDIHARAGAHGLVTTPSAGKLYNNITRQTQYQAVTLTVDEQAVLEWLPQETIVFDGADGELTTEVHLSDNAHFIGWDIICLGRPSSEDWFKKGTLKQTISVWHNRLPLFIERNHINAESALMSLAAGLAGQPVFGTCVLVDHDDHVSPLNDEERAMLEQLAAPGLFVCTHKPNVILVRYLGPCAETAKRVFVDYWQLKRPELLGKPACPPRIWNT